VNREAAILDLKLQLGLIKVRKVARWLAAQFPAAEESTQDSPRGLSSSEESVMQQLLRLHDGIALSDVMPEVLGASATRLRDDRSLARRVAMASYNIWVDEGKAGCDELHELASIQEALQEARSGYGDSVSSVIHEFVDFATSLRGTD
jgi:hypothetical protein